MKTTNYILLICLLLASGLAYGQGGDWEQNNEQSLDSYVYEVFGDKEIRLPQAARIYDPIPPQPYERINPNLQYQFGSYFYGASPVVLRLRPRPIAAQPEGKLYGNYVKGGFGNFITPYMDLYLASKRQREFSYGVRFNYLNSARGPVDEENSGAGTLNAAIFGSAYGEKATLSGSAQFSRDNLHFYGYMPGTVVAAEDIKQYFNRISLKTSISNTKQEGDFHYNLGIQLDNLSDNFDAKETAIGADVKTSLQVMEEAWMDIDAGVQSISRNDPNFTGESRLHLYGLGGLKYLKDKLIIVAKLRFDYLSDTLASNEGVKIFPVANLTYSLTDDFVVSGGIDGGVQRTSLNSMSQDNPFIESGLYIAHSVKQLGINGKIAGAISSEVGVSAGFEYSRLKNSHYFVNSMTDISRFTVLYDSGVVNLFNPYLSISYNKDETYRVGLRADYFGYAMGILDQPWHKPTYQVGVNTDLLFVDKIRFTTDINFVGGILALDTGAEKELDPFLDLNVGLEYLAGTRLSIFLNGGNLLGKNYMRFNNYPVKGIQVMGGLSYKF